MIQSQNIYRKAKGFSFETTFQANASTYAVVYQAEYSGYLELVSGSNFSAYTIQVGQYATIYTAIPSGGILITKGQTLAISVTAIDENLPVVCVVSAINFNTQTQQRSITPASSVYDRYVYTLHYLDKTVTCIDAISNTPVATIALPIPTNLTTYNTLEYRIVNKSVYVFANLFVTRIDADPDSPTFNQCFNPETNAANEAKYYSVFGMGGYAWTIRSICYDHIDDVFWGDINGYYCVYYNPSTHSMSYNIYKLRGGAGNNLIFVDASNCVYTVAGRYNKTEGISDRFVEVNGASFQWYDKIANCIIYSVNGTLGRMSLEHTILQTVSINANVGGFFHYTIRVEDFYYTFTSGGLSAFATKVHVTNALTFTYVGEYVLPDCLPQDAMSSVTYSEAAGRFYALGKPRNNATNYNRIYVFNVNAWDKTLPNIADLYEGYIEAGNNMSDTMSYLYMGQVCKTGLRS